MTCHAPVLAVFVVLVLGTACGSASTRDAETRGQIPVAPVPQVERGKASSYLSKPVEVKGSWRLGFVAKDAVPTEGDGRLWGRAWLAMKRYAEARGVSMRLVPTACQTCIEDQIVKLDLLAEMGDLDGLIVGAVDSVHVAPVIEKVIGSGVPTLAFDTPVDAESVLTLVTNDNVATGRAVGEWVVSQLGGKGQVAVLNGPWGHQNALERRAGIFEGLSTGDLALVASEPARWKRNLAADEVRRWRTQFPRLKAIIAANDAMALGARDAWSDVEDRPLITGVDGDPEAVSAVAKGRIDLTVNRDAEQEGRLAVELMLRHLENQETFPPMVVVSDFELVGAGEDAP